MVALDDAFDDFVVVGIKMSSPFAGINQALTTDLFIKGKYTHTASICLFRINFGLKNFLNKCFYNRVNGYSPSDKFIRVPFCNKPMLRWQVLFYRSISILFKVPAVKGYPLIFIVNTNA